MATKAFITGVTGYIGGDAFHAIHESHPDYEYTALVRSPDRGAKVAAVYPKIRLVYGTLDDSAVIEEEASKANIVLHTADSSAHLGAAQAISKGLAAGHTKTNPGFWIHLSGTAILTWYDSKHKRSGEAPANPPYDDLDDVSALTSLPDEAFYRKVEKIVLGSNSETVKTAIVCPPVIYGIGRGTGNKRSKQTEELIDKTLEKGTAPIVGAGLAQWDHVHVFDLSDLFLSLIDKAASWTGSQSSDEHEIWGEKGYFFAENGYQAWGDVSRRVAEVAYEKGFIKENKTFTVTNEQVIEMGGFVAASWGWNSRGLAKRARKFLGWIPKQPTLHETIPEIMDGEAKRMGLVTGHAQKVAEATK